MVNEKRLIDANALREKIKEVSKGADFYRPIYECFLNAVEHAPTVDDVDVVTVVNGRWEWFEEWRESSPDGPAECQNAGWQCSECKIDLAEYLSETLGEPVYCDDPDRYPTINRCPSCGAKMDLEGSK